MNDDLKNKVQQATDIVELIGEHVTLHNKGREYACVCPFHDDHNPSMSIVPHKQIFYCFVCHAGGDVFSFVQKYHHLTFPEALKFLAERVGIEYQPAPGRSSDRPSQRQAILDANMRAASFFQLALESESGKVAAEYLQKRGISREMILEFAIGYAPDGWSNLLDEARKRSWPVDGLDAAGLLSHSSKSERTYDRFRHRLMFPICDEVGKVIAFGGRKLRDEDDPKYLNSPEHEAFNKSRTLYGLHLAKQAIAKEERAIIVEGYTDVIACHQAGIRNVVATLGTAFTSQHVSMLRRFAPEVVLIFDSDDAGRKAADRAVELFLSEPIDVSVAAMPDGLDPADLLQQEDGKARWEQALTTRTPALEYQLARLRDAINNQSTMTGREQLIQNYLGRLTELGLGKGTQLRRAMVMQRLADITGLPESDIREQLRKLTEDASRRQRVRQAQPEQDDPFGDMPIEQAETVSLAPAQRRAERMIIGALLCQPSLFHDVQIEGRGLDETVAPADFVSAAPARLYEVIYDMLSEDEPMVLSQLTADLNEKGKSDLADLAIALAQEMERMVGKETDRLHKIAADAAAVLGGHDKEMPAPPNQPQAEIEEDQLAVLSRRMRERAARPDRLRMPNPN